VSPFDSDICDTFGVVGVPRFARRGIVIEFVEFDLAVLFSSFAFHGGE